MLGLAWEEAYLDKLLGGKPLWPDVWQRAGTFLTVVYLL